MCQSNAYLIKANGSEELVMEDVSLITPGEKGEIALTGLFGDQLTLNAELRELDLLKHRIVLAETAT
jgi:predicted RNA-binding protein